MGNSRQLLMVLSLLLTVVTLGSSQSPDGSCGATSAGNYSCAQGFCCSQFGWCGNTVDHCGTGCQPAYGTCGGGGGPVSSEGTCGATSAGNYSCAQGFCCSQYNWCGTTVDHCGAGCQTAYGTCGGGTPSLPEPAPPGTPASPGLEMKSCVQNGHYALTFDDGPSNLTLQVVRALDKLNVKATFFVVGQNLENTAENQPLRESFLAAYGSGHLVASHSYSHPHFPDLTEAQMRDEITRTSNLFQELLGSRPRYFRAPYGEINTVVVDVLKEFGYNLINWNLDARDWEVRNETLILSSIQTALDSAAPSDQSWIDVNHDTVPATVNAVERIVGLVQSRGYRIVPMVECVGDAQRPYT